MSDFFILSVYTGLFSIGSLGGVLITRDLCDIRDQSITDPPRSTKNYLKMAMGSFIGGIIGSLVFVGILRVVRD